MGFANLGLLGLGLALLSIPLLLLLINRKRQVIPWAAYYWMKLAAQKKKKRVRVTEWLKLLSKLLLILAAALLMARPFLGLDSVGRTLVVVDNSLSMQTIDGNATRLETARERAAAVIRETDGAISLASFDGELTMLADGQDGAANLDRLLPGIQPGAGDGNGVDLATALLALDDLASYSQVVVISDFTQAHYGDGAALETLNSRLPDGVRLALAPVDARQSIHNLTLVDWRLAPEGLHAGRENRIDVLVRNTGNEAVDQLTVTLALDGEDRDQAYVSLAAGEERWLPLSCPLLDGEARELRISLPPDSYPLDDTLLVVLRPPRKLNVLSVRPEPGPEDRFPRDIFMRSALLAVGGDTAWNINAVSPRQAPYEQLTNYDLIVLFGQSLRPEDPLTGRLLKAVEAGRGAIVFGDVQQTDMWSGIGVAHGAAVEAERTIDPQRLTGGYLEFLQADGSGPSQIHVFRYLPLTDVPPAQARLYLAGEPQPVVRSLPLGQGRLVVAGFQPAPGYTDLYYNPNFVQFMQRLAWDAMGKQPDAGAIGDAITALRVPDISLNHRYTLAAAGEAPRQLAMLPDSQPLALELEPVAAPAFYTVYADESPVYAFGGNPSRGDSAIQSAGDALAELAGDRVSVLRDGGDGGGATQELIWLGLLAFIAALALEHYAHLTRRT